MSTAPQKNLKRWTPSPPGSGNCDRESLVGDKTFAQALHTFSGFYLRLLYETIFDFLLARSSLFVDSST